MRIDTEERTQFVNEHANRGLKPAKHGVTSEVNAFLNDNLNDVPSSYA